MSQTQKLDTEKGKNERSEGAQNFLLASRIRTIPPLTPLLLIELPRDIDPTNSTMHERKGCERSSSRSDKNDLCSPSPLLRVEFPNRERVVFPGRIVEALLTPECGELPVEQIETERRQAIAPRGIT